MTFLQTLITSIVTAVITGLISIVGVILTIRHNNKQHQAQIDEHKEDKKQKIIENRPEFEIIKREYFDNKMGYYRDESAHLDLMVTVYGEYYSKYDFENNLVMVEYIIKNIGKSKVENIDLCFYNNNVELLDMKRSDIDKFIENPIRFPTSTFLRFAGKEVHHDEEIKIRIWYRSNNVIQRQLLSYPSFIGIQSFDQRFWYQNFDTPYDELEGSVLITRKRYLQILYRKDQDNE